MKSHSTEVGSVHGTYTGVLIHALATQRSARQLTHACGLTQYPEAGIHANRSPQTSYVCSTQALHPKPPTWMYSAKPNTAGTTLVASSPVPEPQEPLASDPSRASSEVSCTHFHMHSLSSCARCLQDWRAQLPAWGHAACAWVHGRQVCTVYWLMCSSLHDSTRYRMFTCMHARLRERCLASDVGCRKAIPPGSQQASSILRAHHVHPAPEITYCSRSHLFPD